MQQFNALCQQAYQDIQSAPLRLGISVALVPDYLPNLGEVLEAFRQQYPAIPWSLLPCPTMKCRCNCNGAHWMPGW